MKPSLLEKFLTSIAAQPFAQPVVAVATAMGTMGIGGDETADILRTLATTITQAAAKSALRVKAAPAQPPAAQDKAKGPTRRRGE